jgi:hypothetical protein
MFLQRSCHTEHLIARGYSIRFSIGWECERTREKCLWDKGLQRDMRCIERRRVKNFLCFNAAKNRSIKRSSNEA